MSSVYCQRIYTLDLNFGFLLAAPTSQTRSTNTVVIAFKHTGNRPFLPLSFDQSPDLLSISGKLYFISIRLFFITRTSRCLVVVVAVERIQCSFKQSIQVVNNDRPQESLITPDRRGTRSSVVKMELALPVPVVGSGSALPPLSSIKEVLVTVSTYFTT